MKIDVYRQKQRSGREKQKKNDRYCEPMMYD